MRKLGVPEGAMTKYLPPLSPGNRAAVTIWNRLGGELGGADLALELAAVDDQELMLARLRALRDHLRRQGGKSQNRP